MKPSDRIPSPAAPAASIEDTAVDWFVRRDAGLDAGEAVELQGWLDANPAHAAAFAEAGSAFGRLQRPRELGHGGALMRRMTAREAQRRAWRRRRYAVAGLAAAAAIAFFAPPVFRAPRANPSPTVAVRPDQQVLADGSIVQLNADAEIQVAFSPERRDVRLLRGEARFSVAKDAARPFIVATGGVEVRAVGTVFVVRNAPQVVDILVTEGRVAVARLPAPGSAAGKPLASAPVFVDAGNRMTIPVEPASSAAIPVARVSPAEIERALAWRDKRIEFSGTSLAEAVGLFNRQNRAQISLGTPSLAGLRISGIFWADNPAHFARLLEMTLPVKAEIGGGGGIVLRSAP
jgi:transmembrane sensor